MKKITLTRIYGQERIGYIRADEISNIRKAHDGEYVGTISLKLWDDEEERSKWTKVDVELDESYYAYISAEFLSKDDGRLISMSGDVFYAYSTIITDVWGDAVFTDAGVAQCHLGHSLRNMDALDIHERSLDFAKILHEVFPQI